MAIYRPPRSRWRAGVVVPIVGLVLGALVVFAFLRSNEPDATEQAAAARARLVEAEGLLEIVAIEYGESVRAAEVVSQTEYDGAIAALQRSRSKALAAAGELDDPGLADLEAAYDRVAGLIDEKAAAEEIEAAIDELTETIEKAVKGT